MSALSQVGHGPSGDLFKKGGSALGSFEFAQKESRNSYDIGAKKKGRAPPPPSGLGHYKPKILSSESSGNVPVPRTDDSPVPPPRPSRRSRGSSNLPDMGGAKPIVIGDKDVPMVLTPQHDLQDVDLNVSSLNLTSHDLLNGHQDSGTDNPLFSMHDENTAASQPTANPLSNHNSQDSSAPQPTDNPLVGVLDERESSQHMLDSDPGDNHKKNEDTKPEGLYIPAPDYDEEELTIAMAEEPVEDYPQNPRRHTQVYKEYDGEDFGQYLSDEENGNEEILPRRPPRSHHPMDIKSKTEVKRSYNKKRQPLPTQTKTGKTGYSSVRTFSYADSKFGTVNGNKKRPSCLSGPEKTKEDDFFTGASYEHFLYSKSGEDWDQPGRDYGYMQEASPVGSRQAHSKDSVWKRLTWKVKKQMNSFDVTASS